MGSGATSRWGLEYPEPTDTVNVPGDIETLANDLDTLLFSLAITAKSASYAATVGQLVQMTGAHTVTSPAAASNVMWGVLNASSGTAVTVVPASGTLNLPGNYGTSSLSLTKQGDFAVFVCDGTNHNLIAGSADIMGLSVTAAAIEATFTAAGQFFVGTGSGTGQLTQLPRTNTLAVSSNTYTPNCGTTDFALISSPTAAFTVANPTGTPTDGQKLLLRIDSGGTGYTPTWGSAYLSSGIATLPVAALPASKNCTLGFVYDLARTSWVLLAADTSGY